MYEYVEILLSLALKVSVDQKKYIYIYILRCDVNSSRQGK